MRAYIVFTLLLVMLVGFGVLLGTRERPDRATRGTAGQPPRAAADADAPDGAPRGSGAGGRRDGGAADGGARSAPATRPGGDGGPPTAVARDASAEPSRAATPDAAASGASEPRRDGGAAPSPAKVMDRPLRVVGLGWELIAPGVVANRGTTPGDRSRFVGAGLEVHLSSAERVVDVERALARGGGDEAGADVAIVPLPVLVASYEQLRALAPEVFFVIGWSHGQEALMSVRADPLVDARPDRATQVLVEAGTPAHLLALFALDLAGVPPERVEEVDAGTTAGDTIDLAAFRQPPRGPPAGAAARRYVLTTAEASRLVPFVAVAPAGLIDAEPDALRVLCDLWLAGVDELRQDVPTAARHIASIRGAPEALELLGSMGRVETSSLRENAALAGLSGRDAVTLASLVEVTWRLFRAAEVVTTLRPDVLPIDSSIVASLVRAGGALADAPGGTLGVAEESPETLAIDANGARPVIVSRFGDRTVDRGVLVERLGFLAGVFAPLALRVVVPGRDASVGPQIVETARARFGLEEGRLSAARRVTGRNAPAAIEILPR